LFQNSIFAAGFFAPMRYLLIFVVLLSAASCGEYNQVLKSNDPEYKYSKALEYFEAGDCYRALPIFEELIGVTRGTQRAEQVYYYYAHVHYCIGDYYLANYYFKNFAKTYSTSEFAEECMFLAAMCNYNLSPNSTLDQQDTQAAIDEFQLYLNKFPNSEKVDSCYKLIGDLNLKLEKKAFDIASLYVKTEKHKAALIALENMLNDYPGTVYTEDVMFLIIKSHFSYAERSIEMKKLERYEACTKSYYNFAARFPDSGNLKEAESFFKRSVKAMEKLEVATN